jgi:hypothetical protein
MPFLEPRAGGLICTTDDNDKLIDVHACRRINHPLDNGFSKKRVEDFRRACQEPPAPPGCKNEAACFHS